MLHVVVMAGGSGTRFWPQSRRQLPKQFLHIGTEKTLLQETIDRTAPLVPPERTWVVTGAAHVDETRQQLTDLPASQLLVEPCGRNTAPCIALAAIRLLKDDPAATMLVVPADHVIRPAETFRAAVQTAVAHLEQHPDALMLFGVPPTYPATGFGYMHRGAAIQDGGGMLYRVQSFHEKPDLLTAARYAATDEYLWNCGIFVWSAAAVLKALADYKPELSAGICRMREALDTPAWDAVLNREFPELESISIDHAVLEKAVNVSVLSAPFEWDDVGSWQAMPRLLPHDSDGNTVDGLFAGVDTSHCIVRSSHDHLVAAIGVKDLIIVHTPTATLVADRRDEAAIKRLLVEIERQGLDAYL